MNKKILMTLFMFCGQSELLSYSRYFDHSSNGFTITEAAAAVATVVTLLYWSQREPNAVKTQRAHAIWDDLYPSMKKCTSFYDVQKFLVHFDSYDNQIGLSYRCLNNRYNSWVKPWNWSHSMQDAYAKINLLSIMFAYKHLIASWSSMNDAALISHMKRLKSSNRYPLIAAVAQLKRDIMGLETAISKYTCVLLVQDMLDVALQVISTSHEYDQELRNKAVDEMVRAVTSAAVRITYDWSVEKSKHHYSYQGDVSKGKDQYWDTDEKNKAGSTENISKGKDQYWEDDTKGKDQYW